jgi:ribosomal protein S27AE
VLVVGTIRNRSKARLTDVLSKAKFTESSGGEVTKDYSRSLELLCPTCAGASFEFDHDVGEAVRTYQCGGCGGSFSHEDLIQSNSPRIDAEIGAIGEEVLGDALRNLRKSFAGNKFIKIK